MFDIINQYQNIKEKRNHSLLYLCSLIKPYLDDIQADILEKCCQKTSFNKMNLMNPYHNVLHHSFVMYHGIRLFSNPLIYRNVDENDFGLLMIASSIHDYDYGSNFNEVNDQKEINSFKKACSDGILNGLSEYELNKVYLLFLSTKIINREKLRSNSNNDFLDELNRNNITIIAKIISDADLTQSLYFGHDNFIEQTNLLEMENGKKFSKDEITYFVNKIGGKPLIKDENIISFIM